MSKDTSRDYIIPAPQIGQVVGLHQRTVRQMSEAGQFPEKIVLSPRKHGYMASEVFAWLDDRRRCLS